MIGASIKKVILTFSACLATDASNNGKLMRSRCAHVNIMRFVGGFAYLQVKYGNGLLRLQGISIKIDYLN